MSVSAKERNENNFREDMVNSPSHYSKHCSLECIDVMEVIFGEEVVCWFCLCNTFKYLWRFKFKNGKEDIDKAEWYLNRANFLIGMGDEVKFHQQIKIRDRLRSLIGFIKCDESNS